MEILKNSIPDHVVIYTRARALGLERGPQGEIHFPKYQDGCYHRRVTDCCLCCIGRLVISSAAASARYRIGNVRASEKDDLVEEKVVVPHFDSSSKDYVVEYKSGTIEEVYVLSDAEPAIVRVKTEDDDRIDINYVLAEQEETVER